MVDQRDAEVYRDYSQELIRSATVLVGPMDAPDVLSDAFVSVLSSPLWLASETTGRTSTAPF